MSVGKTLNHDRICSRTWTLTFQYRSERIFLQRPIKCKITPLKMKFQHKSGDFSMCFLLVYSHKEPVEHLDTEMGRCAQPFHPQVPFPVMITSTFSKEHTGALYNVHIYSRCSRPPDSLALLACKHVNGKHLEQEPRRPTGAGMSSEPAVHPTVNASLWVPGLITPRAQTSGTMFPPETRRRTCRTRARRLWKPALSLTGLPFSAGEQKPFKSHWQAGLEHFWNLCDEITLKMEWHEVYTAINKLECGRA